MQLVDIEPISAFFFVFPSVQYSIIGGRRKLEIFESSSSVYWTDPKTPGASPAALYLVVVVVVVFSH